MTRLAPNAPLRIAPFLAPRLAIVALLVTIAPIPAGAQGVPSPDRCGSNPSLTYLANTAVLVRGTHTVLIDGPFTEGVEPYPRMTAESLRRARAADPPFDEVDWILVTHAHADHGDPRAIADLLTANPTARLASTRAVVERVRSAAPPDLSLAERAVVVEPAEGEFVVVRDRAPRIEALALHHGRNRPVDNLGFLVDIDGVRLLHVGDAEVVVSDIEPLGLAERRIDVALLPTWYVRSERFRPALDALGARRILLTHFPRRQSADRLFRRAGGWDAVMRRIAGYEPPVVPLIRRSSVNCLVPSLELSTAPKP
ncbi:MAG: MBL fold metallo-hydrolase [Gemmatimonadota bacterium]